MAVLGRHGMGRHYQILRDGYGSGETDPVALEVTPGVTTTVPAIGLNVPNRYPIRLPPVPTGTYRIIDQARAGVSASADT